MPPEHGGARTARRAAGAPAAGLASRARRSARSLLPSGRSPRLGPARPACAARRHPHPGHTEHHGCRRAALLQSTSSRPLERSARSGAADLGASTRESLRRRYRRVKPPHSGPKTRFWAADQARTPEALSSGTASPPAAPAVTSTRPVQGRGGRPHRTYADRYCPNHLGRSSRACTRRMTRHLLAANRDAYWNLHSV